MYTPTSPAEREVRRKIAGQLLLEGKSISEVARIVKASKSSVKGWKDAVDQGGFGGFERQAAPWSQTTIESRSEKAVGKDSATRTTRRRLSHRLVDL